MKILVSNDDGIYARGLWALVKELKEVGEVIVVAPDRQQSAVGTSVTLHYPLRVKKVKPRLSGVETYSVEGTPADSVILGLRMLAKDDVDLVISGINEGLNLGNDVFISGTVGAALQGYFYEIPAIAISTALVGDKVRFDTAARIGALLAKKVQQNDVLPGTLLNVNLPYLPLRKIQGIQATRLGRRSYRDEIKKGNDGRRDYYWIVRSEPERGEQKGTDIWAIRKNKISITLLQGNLANSSRRRCLAALCSSLFQELRPTDV
ncbi:MAG: 5'/3'-nucleotidase SurE [Dehalococcoidia bacterium]|nr:5'-nucleotidase SurE [Chloroflexota bacterium]MBT9162331.1 5'-nucleotidase SurE [Chloroflexota bacterium]